MKWPVRGLEARLKASFRRLFRSRHSHQYTRRHHRSQSEMRVVHLHSIHCDSQDDRCLQCYHYDTDSSWGDSQNTIPSSQCLESADKHTLEDSMCLHGIQLKNRGIKMQAQAEIRRKPRDLGRSDVSVSTEFSQPHHYQDAGSQAEFEGSKPLVSLIQSDRRACSPPKKPNMISVATEPVIFDSPETKYSSLRSLAQKSLSYQDGTSRSLSHFVFLGHCCSDPFLFDHIKLTSSRLDSSKESVNSFFHAGDSCKPPSRKARSNLGVPHCSSGQYRYQGLWTSGHSVPVKLFETTVSQSHCSSQNDNRRPTSDSPYVSIPRPNWYASTHYSDSNSLDKNNDQVTRVISPNRQKIYSNPQLETIGMESLATFCSGHKELKECGDEYLPAVDTSLNSTGAGNSNPTTNETPVATNTSTNTSVAANNTLVNTNEMISLSSKVDALFSELKYPSICSVAVGDDTPSLERERISSGSRALMFAIPNPDPPTNTTRVFGVSGRRIRESKDVKSDAVHDRKLNGSFHKDCAVGSRKSILTRTKSTSSKDSRSWRSQRTCSDRKSDVFRTRRSDDTHHNGYSHSHEVNSKVEKSEASQKRSSAVPGSTSDDGDQGQTIVPDMISVASTRTKNCTAPVARINSKKRSSKSSAETKKPVKQGALPANRDLHQCPTGRHPDVKADKPCICIMVKRMVLAQSKPVLYSWHCQSTKNGNSQVKSPMAGEGNDAKATNPGPSSPCTYVPSLPNFQLARPTRMVRGGQGTVAWVSHVGTGLYYALKFKQRDGRSESTWEIERREAKLLRFARHEFIVRLYHIYETDETLFMALEWLEGGCLWNHIARMGTMPECYAIYYGSCILTALRYLHSQCIVYRDMKAENIVLDQRGRPKLIDFGMAKRFGKPKSEKDDCESPADDSLLDSEDFAQPPTRYYFAAYLAPEIYDPSETTNQFIDSWGLGYILVEMILGYGIFLPMPWEKDPGQHLSENWKLRLPGEASAKMSVTCEDFLYKMLVRRPEDRLTLEQATKHGLFVRVPWSNLSYMRGPDLSKCPPKGSNATQPGQSNTTTGRRWTSKYDSFGHVPDTAFAREFLGSIISQPVAYSSQSLVTGQRRTKTVRIPNARTTNDTTFATRSTGQDFEKSRSTTVVSRTSRNINVGGAIEIRNVTATSVEAKKDGNKMTRGSRHPGVSAN
ncbi:Serine threonine protein kinase nrc [Fasciolopsis buskii]|uniref:non-specific serine/threonine protein kinase n=1 Tax=Fasciolopsis buskii TaxID=27845 RepID=A0A8E0RQG1_9TREM|nr:Serine threonine protein kinase nrc [Fasciolopsis buski]